jgi:hypothetical protein
MTRSVLLFAMLVCFLVIGSPAIAALTDGLILYFPFDEGKGEVVEDHSGNGHDGKILNFKQMDWDKGKFENAIVMSAKGAEKLPHASRLGRIEVTDDLGNPKALSISVWFNATVDISWNYLGDFRPTGSWFARDSSQNIKLDGQGQVGSGDYPREEWVHLVVLADSKSTTYYINGKETGVAGGAAKLNISTNLHVGSRFSKNESFLTHLDDWAMWDRILSDKEITELGKGPVIPLAVDPQDKAATTWGRIKSR